MAKQRLGVATRDARAGLIPSEPTYEELKAKLADLESKNGPRELEFRVGEKGGVSVYGLGRFPVTLYFEQWMRVLEAAPRLREFLEKEKAAKRLKLKAA